LAPLCAAVALLVSPVMAKQTSMASTIGVKSVIFGQSCGGSCKCGDCPTDPCGTSTDPVCKKVTPRENTAPAIPAPRAFRLLACDYNWVKESNLEDPPRPNPLCPGGVCPKG
jgi:hypothetical protein